MLRYNYLDASRDLPPHPFVLSVNNTGRGPNASSLPFQNAGYTINNNLNSFALELNSRSTGWANRFFASYNRFRDNRDPNSVPFPTIEIGEGGVTYTTAGHEPFSIHNILDQNVLQFTDNFSLYRGKHTLTLGANYESFSFFNSFNIFRNGFLPAVFGRSGCDLPLLAEFWPRPTPTRTAQLNDSSAAAFKGRRSASASSFYAQDRLLLSGFTLTRGRWTCRSTTPSRWQPVLPRLALDENDNPGGRSGKLADHAALVSPGGLQLERGR
jgi:hypothetical protein